LRAKRTQYTAKKPFPPSRAGKGARGIGFFTGNRI
jgi:hypothetical protein